MGRNNVVCRVENILYCIYIMYTLIFQVNKARKCVLWQVPSPSARLAITACQGPHNLYSTSKVPRIKQTNTTQSQHSNNKMIIQDFIKEQEFSLYLTYHFSTFSYINPYSLTQQLIPIKSPYEATDAPPMTYYVSRLVLRPCTRQSGVQTKWSYLPKS